MPLIKTRDIGIAASLLLAAVLVAGCRVAGPFMDDGHAFTSLSTVSAASAGMSSMTIPVTPS